MHRVRVWLRKLGAERFLRHLEQRTRRATSRPWRLLPVSVLSQQLHVSTHDIQFPIKERDPAQDRLERQEAQDVDQEHMMLVLLVLAVVRQYRVDQLVLFLGDAESGHAELRLDHPIDAKVVLRSTEYARLRVEVLHDVEVAEVEVLLYIVNNLAFD